MQNAVVFNQELGELKSYHALIHVDLQAHPRFCNPIPVPYAMRAKVDEELDHMVESGVLEPMQYAEWAASIMAVWKPDRS